MVVRHSGRNQNACKHTAAGTATAERSIWGQVLGTDFIEARPDDVPVNKESLVAATGHEDLLRATEEVDRVRPSSSRARPLAPLG
jgi:hypothetical protein